MKTTSKPLTNLRNIIWKVRARNSTKASKARNSTKASKPKRKYGTLAFERERAKQYREKIRVLKENNRKLQEIINRTNLDTKFALNALGLSPTKSVSSIATTFMSPTRSLSAISSTSSTPLLVSYYLIVICLNMLK
jgi:glutamate synthase domain-containing protein 2